MRRASFEEGDGSGVLVASVLCNEVNGAILPIGSLYFALKNAGEDFILYLDLYIVINSLLIRVNQLICMK